MKRRAHRKSGVFYELAQNDFYPLVTEVLMNSLSGVRIGTRNQDKKNREKKKNKDSIVLGTPSSIPHKQNPETLPNGPVD